MLDIGPLELVIILVIALVVLGPKRLPDAGRALGKGINEFKDGLAGKPDHDALEDVEVREPTTGASR